jgi:hypothetical protein
MAEAKRLFSMDFLTGFRFTTAFGDEEWVVSFCDAKGSWGELLPTKGSQPRIFKTLDAAVRTVRDVGFKVSALSHS